MMRSKALSCKSRCYIIGNGTSGKEGRQLKPREARQDVDTADALINDSWCDTMGYDTREYDRLLISISQGPPPSRYFGSAASSQPTIAGHRTDSGTPHTSSHPMATSVPAERRTSEKATLHMYFIVFYYFLRMTWVLGMRIDASPPGSFPPRMAGFTAETEWQEGPDQISFFTKRWSPTSTARRAKLIFLHGFMEHIDRYDHVFSRYAEAGIEVFGFDQRGFGQTAAKTNTQGRTSWAAGLKDADYFISREAAPERVNGLKVFLMGHSMGGGIAFAYPTRSPPPVGLALITGGLVLSSPLIAQTPGVATPGPLIRIGSFIGALLPKLTLKVGVAPQDICRDPAIQEQYAHDPLCKPIGTFKGVADMILGGQGLLARDYQAYQAELALLAVHGTADKVTFHDATQQLVEKTNANDKTFKDFEGYYHEMHNEPGDYKWVEIDFIIQWIISHSST